MTGTSYLEFFKNGRVPYLTGLDKIVDKMAMVLQSTVFDVPFMRRSRANGLIDGLYKLDTEMPDAVLAYKVRSILEGSIGGISVRDVVVDRVDGKVKLSIYAVYYGSSLSTVVEV